MNVKAVILAGGQGTRFWPYSSSERPKQFLAVLEEKTMLQATYQRLLQLLPPEDIYVVTLQPYVPLVSRQLPQLPGHQIIIEPAARDTAAAIGLAAIRLLDEGQDPVLITLPADQYIGDNAAYTAALKQAAGFAAEGQRVVTLGIQPDRPDTGLGYIKAGPVPPDMAPGGFIPAAGFTEKPPLPVAKQIYADGRHYWNSGTYIWKAATILKLMAEHMPRLYQTLQHIRNLPLPGQTPASLSISKMYEQLEKQSIDYGVIEKCSSIFMLPVHFKWDDLGSWGALERISPGDTSGNVIYGKHGGSETDNCTIFNDTDTLIATVGLKDLIIVNTDTAILICHKSRLQDIRHHLESVRNSAKEESL
ncbi:mannose-1-phosphate guanyltransferase [Paenibacillus sambharensis]|uniref:Mannose-1-phosphate guanyltransferase n=1 Tax=Paenibacillus sambharensis TaxID=1803190 RepID=A0A2W1LBS1_9BACL|nr:sugar phosphate nucleotidyltransferase [Paenibacillus sambharensis]PZD95570.1 mannose-1-phosphate guanyltransferase [Paenibacillus sambharensis]